MATCKSLKSFRMSGNGDPAGFFANRTAASRRCAGQYVDFHGASGRELRASGAHAHTRLGATGNRFLTYAYGHPSVLYAPRHVVTDSHQRLIISDPAANALHVLDRKGKTSFRIVCGKDRRLRKPSGVRSMPPTISTLPTPNVDSLLSSIP